MRQTQRLVYNIVIVLRPRLTVRRRRGATRAFARPPSDSRTSPGPGKTFDFCPDIEHAEYAPRALIFIHFTLA